MPKQCYEEREKIEYIEFENEFEMDLAERYFIPKYHPKYNIVLNDKEINFNLEYLDNKLWLLYEPNNNKNTMLDNIIINDKYIEEKINYLDTIKNIKKEEIQKKYYKKIIDISTGKIYENLNIASKKYNISLDKLYKHCEYWCEDSIYYNKKQNLYLDLFDEEYETHIHFMYYENYLNSPSKKYIDKSIQNTTQKVICITTEEIFNNRKVAEKKYKLIAIENNCKGLSNYCGTQDGKPLIWMYYNDYIKFSEEKIKDKIDTAYYWFYKKNKVA